MKKRTADENEIRAEAQRLDDVGSPPHAAIVDDRHAAFFGGNFGQDLERRNGRVEIAPPMVRYHYPVETHAPGGPGVFGIEDAFEQQPALPTAAEPLHVFPIERIAVHAPVGRRPGEDRHAAPGAVILDMGHAGRHQGPEEAPEQPARMKQPVNGDPEGRPHGVVKPLPQIDPPVRRHRGVDGYDQGSETRVPGPVGECRDGVPLVDDVGLEPGVGVGLGDLFHGDQRAAAHQKRNVRFRRRPREGEVGLKPEQGAGAHGRDAERRPVRLAEQLLRRAPAGHIGENFGFQPVPVERGPVAAQRDPAVGARGNEFPQGGRQKGAGGRGEIFQALDAAK